MYRLAVIVVNFKTPELVIQGLCALESELDHDEDCAIVVDNHSGDGSVERIQEGIKQRHWGGWASLVEASSNRGFSAGNNVGIRAVAAKYYLLLNSDAYVREGAIARFLAIADSDTKAGVIAPRLEWPNGEPQTSCFRAPSPLSELVSAAPDATHFIASTSLWSPDTGR